MVAGAPGAGKSTVAQLLLTRLHPVPALLDKDTLFGGLVASLLDVAGRPDGVREGTWYDEHVKVHEYAGMSAGAREIRAAGCPVVLVGPFTAEIRDAARWAAWVSRLGGAPVRLVWVRSDAPTLRARLTERQSVRDAGKLAVFDQFVTRMRPDEPPPVPHLEIDNRAGAAPLHVQIESRLPTALADLG